MYRRRAPQQLEPQEPGSRNLGTEAMSSEDRRCRGVLNPEKHCVITTRRSFRDTLHHAHSFIAIRKHNQRRAAVRVHDYDILPPAIVAPLPEIPRSGLLFDAPA